MQNPFLGIRGARLRKNRVLDSLCCKSFLLLRRQSLSSEATANLRCDSLEFVFNGVSGVKNPAELPVESCTCSEVQGRSPR